jgi:hypothetical protein
MPRWKYNIPDFKKKLSISEAGEDQWPNARDAAAEVLLRSKWYLDQGEDDLEREYSDLGELIKEWQAADEVEWADSVLNQIYDLADEDRAWLGL